MQANFHFCTRTDVRQAARGGHCGRALTRADCRRLRSASSGSGRWVPAGYAAGSCRCCTAGCLCWSPGPAARAGGTPRYRRPESQLGPPAERAAGTGGRHSVLAGWTAGQQRRRLVTGRPAPAECSSGWRRSPGPDSGTDCVSALRRPCTGQREPPAPQQPRTGSAQPAA